MLTNETKVLLDECWHAMFHLDVREISKHLPKEEVDAIYEAACKDAEILRFKIEGMLAKQRA